MVRTQEAECCGAAVLSRWGWSPPLNARRHLLSSFRGGARASRLVQPMSSKEGRRIFICPATGHAVKDPVGPFCGDHGAKMFSDCRAAEVSGLSPGTREERRGPISVLSVVIPPR